MSRRSIFDLTGSSTAKDPSADPSTSFDPLRFDFSSSVHASVFSSAFLHRTRDNSHDGRRIIFEGGKKMEKNMLSTKCVRIHGMKDDSWTIKDKLNQYRGILKLHGLVLRVSYSYSRRL